MILQLRYLRQNVNFDRHSTLLSTPGSNHNGSTTLSGRSLRIVHSQNYHAAGQTLKSSPLHATFSDEVWLAGTIEKNAHREVTTMHVSYRGLDLGEQYCFIRTRGTRYRNEGRFLGRRDRWTGGCGTRDSMGKGCLIKETKLASMKNVEACDAWHHTGDTTASTDNRQRGDPNEDNSDKVVILAPLRVYLFRLIVETTDILRRYAIPCSWSMRRYLRQTPKPMKPFTNLNYCSDRSIWLSDDTPINETKALLYSFRNSVS